MLGHVIILFVTKINFLAIKNTSAEREGRRDKAGGWGIGRGFKHAQSCPLAIRRKLSCTSVVASTRKLRSIWLVQS